MNIPRCSKINSRNSESSLATASRFEMVNASSFGTSMVTRLDTMSCLPSLLTLSTLSTYQGLTLPPIKLRDESQPGHQPLQPSPHSEPPSQFPTEEGWRTSAPTGLHSIPNPIEPDGSAVLPFRNDPDLATGSPLSAVGPALPSISTIYTLSGQKQPSNISPRADGNTGTLARGGRGILAPKSASQAIGAQRPVLPENAEGLPLSPTSERECMAKPRPYTSHVVRLMPTPPTQSNGQQYESPSSSWPSTTDSVHSGGSIIQDLVRTPLSLRKKLQVIQRVHTI